MFVLKDKTHQMGVTLKSEKNGAIYRVNRCVNVTGISNGINTDLTVAFSK